MVWLRHCYCIQSLCALFRNMWKNLCIKFCKKFCAPLRIYLTTEKKTQQALKKHFLFLCEVVAFTFWCYIQATVTIKHRYHVICGLAHEGENNFSEIVVIKASNHLTLGMAVLVMKDTSMKFFFNTNCACLAQTICKKTASCNFWHGSKQNFSEIAVVKKSTTSTFDKENFC